MTQRALGIVVVACTLACLGVLLTGVALVYPPAALILAGGLGTVIGVILLLYDPDRSTP